MGVSGAALAEQQRHFGRRREHRIDNRLDLLWWWGLRVVYQEPICVYEEPIYVYSNTYMYMKTQEERHFRRGREHRVDNRLDLNMRGGLGFSV